MDDAAILKRISDLVGEEHQIMNRDGSGEGQPDDPERLRALQETLDQCWDLLRQRRALREFGEDPDQAAVRPKSTVERYLQ